MPGVPRPIVVSYPVILAELERSRVAQVALESPPPGSTGAAAALPVQDGAVRLHQHRHG